MVYYFRSDMSDHTKDTPEANTRRTWRQRFTKRTAWIGLAVVVVLAIGVVVLATSNRSNQAGLDQLKSLQRSLQTAIVGANSQGVVTLVNSILDGQANGTFTVTKTQLSTYYLDRASAYLNLKQYKNAVSDYEQAIMLDASNKLAALQGEVEARYKMGDRQQLISAYQQMISLESASQNPMRGSDVAQYQQNIQTLQQGGELQF